MPSYNINSKAQLEVLIKNQKEYKKSVTRAKCTQCKEGWHYKIMEHWSRCNTCGYSGFPLVT